MEWIKVNEYCFGNFFNYMGGCIVFLIVSKICFVYVSYIFIGVNLYENRVLLWVFRVFNIKYFYFGDFYSIKIILVEN